MLWATLFHKFGKQNMRFCERHHVYAVLENPKTHRTEKVYLLLKYDSSGHPYFVRSYENSENSPKRKR